MIAYTKEEIVSATEMARSFGQALKNLISNSVDKYAIAKNNKLEAVLLPIEDYERMKAAEEMIEHYEIFKTIKTRENSSKVSLEDMASKLGINTNEL
ncbi:MAG: prevent-host-death protein [Sulfurovaceae bacterium]|nr:prevent-host-death protein [Sulfurovaceae bacterium]